MLRHFSKIASTFKYTTSIFSNCQQDYYTPKVIEAWINDLQIGLDAMLNDDIMRAEDIFSTKKQDQKLPFPEFGHALLMYTKAVFAMEKVKIEEAAKCLVHVEAMLKRIISNNRKKVKSALPVSSLPSCDSIHSSISVYPDEEKVAQSCYTTSSQQDESSAHFELLYANCILMSATLQFLRDSWIDSIKAAYDFRKAYKIFERLFEKIVGVSIVEYEASITPIEEPMVQDKNLKARRTASYDEHVNQQRRYCKASLCEETLRNGAYFGIGLFNIMFSLLPVKVGKVLNNLGINSSRYTAVSLLKKSYNSQTMYSPLSALVLLAFYTSISVYIHPHINQLIQFKDAKSILNRMEHNYPSGQLWRLFEGKLAKIQGQLDESIALFKQSKDPQVLTENRKRREQPSTTPQLDVSENYFRTTSITEFVQFRSFAIYELGWTYISAGNYFQASESFFCLAGMCNWSRVFYHYVSTCCMIADKLYDKAVLEVRQITNMLEQKKKLGGPFSNSELYAESKVKSWIDISAKKQLSLSDILKHQIINPIWELIYLWNGTTYWDKKVITEIKEQWKRNPEEPILCLIMGVIQRGVEKNIEFALECFSLLLVREDKTWIYPYAMYEIAATHCTILLQERSRGHTNEYRIIVSDWIRCIENYYLQNTHDNEWETRMQLRCQLLTDSCNSV